MVNIQRATLGDRYYWGIEACLQRLKGVDKIGSRFSGDDHPNPDDSLVCSENTGNAEVCQLDSYSKLLSYEKLLNIFLRIHDPNSLNKKVIYFYKEWRESWRPLSINHFMQGLKIVNLGIKGYRWGEWREKLEKSNNIYINYSLNSIKI